VSELVVEPRFSPRRAAWLFFTTPRPRRAASLIFATVAVLITVGWLTARMWPGGDRAATSSDSGAAVAQDSSAAKTESSQPAPAPTVKVPLPSENEINDQLLELKSDIDRLERRMSVLESPRAAATGSQLRRDSGSEHSNQEPIR
jgi:hypothetical protein